MAADESRRLEEALAGRYRLERELGRGGMATVYLAHDLKHDRRVALKVLAPNPATPLAPERFQREIRFAARLQHPHILTVHDSGAAADCLWFTMPYVEGETLRQRLVRERQLPIETAVRIAHQVARALDYAHREGLVHRDIKPENILLSSQGDALVADFGIGKALAGVTSEDPVPTDAEPRDPAGTGGQEASGEAEDHLTQVGAVVGTPRYMSLEQADGAALDGRADIYSLGVVLYEALAGSPPFTGSTAHAVVAQQLQGDPPSLQTVRQDVPPELDAIALRMLARDRADRYAGAGELADALDTLGRAGAEPTARRSRRRWVGGAIAAAVVAALFAGVLRRQMTAPPQLRPSVIAVAPFDVLHPDLALWRDGLVDLLSRNLDGAGPLRTVPPTVVVRRWTGRADPAAAAELGRRTGAELVLYGSLLSSGPDSARLRATLLDAAGGRALGEWEVADAADRMDRLTDSLTLRLLRDLGRTRPIGAVRLAGFSRTSLPVIKAFLQGEQHHRRSQWDSALAWYERAIELDGTFAPALRRASTALGWIRVGYDSTAIAYALGAGVNNHGLPIRDSLLIAAESLLSSLLEAGPFAAAADSAWTPRLRRLFATLEYTTTRYPDDPEAWYLTGEALTHLGSYVARSYHQWLEAFDRAIALDSAYAPSYIHPIDIAAIDGADAVRRYARRYVNVAPRDEWTESTRLVQLLLDSAGGSADPTALLQRVADDVLFDASHTLARLPDSTELGLRVTRFIASRPRSTVPINDSNFVRRELARAFMSRGHLRSAAEALQGQEQAPGFAEAALLGGVPAERAAAVFRQSLSDFTSRQVLAAFPWWASRRDTASLRHAEAWIDSLRRKDPDPNGRFLKRYAAASASAYYHLARADTTAAVELFLGLPDGGCPGCYLDRLTLAQLLVERGRDREAWRILQGEHPSATIVPWGTEVLWTLLRARVADRLGERDRAIFSYAWVAGMWRHADPELQVYVREANDALARLTGERP